MTASNHLLRVGLDYGEEVHWSVKNSYPKTRLFEATFAVANKMEFVYNASSWSSLETKFIFHRFEVAQET